MPNGEADGASGNSAPDALGTALAAQLTPGAERVNIAEWAGGIPQEMATWPQLRVGQRWFPFKQSVVIGVAGLVAALVVGVIAARYLRTLPDVREFIARYPGTSGASLPVQTGFPWWLRAEHYFNFVLLLFIMRSGLQILADHPRLTLDGGCTPDTEFFRMRGPVPRDRSWTAKDDTVALPGWLGLPGVRHTIALARWWHFSLDMFWVANGVLFYILLFSTDQWHRLVPLSWDVFPNALSVAVKYASLNFPPQSGWVYYNALQGLSYFTTVFIAAPLAMVTGILQAPAIAAKFGTGAGFLNRQVVRTVHFYVLLYFCAFLVMHVAMVLLTGARVNLNHITTGLNTNTWAGVWLFFVGVAIVAAAWLVATPFTLRYPRVIQKTGSVLVGWIKGAMEQWDPKAEYTESDISPYFWANGTPPDSAEYARLKSGGFKDFKLKVGGAVENPVELSVDQLKCMTKQEQITQHYCIQGWSGIAKWGGVPMRDIMALARPKPEAKLAVFYSFAHGPSAGSGLYYDAHPIANMAHTQTMLAYEMNGAPLPEVYGAPLRLRDELELGFKQVKWVQAIEFVESFELLGSGHGGFNSDHEFFGWRAPI